MGARVDTVSAARKPAATPGYSGKPLAEKLGIRTGSTLLVSGAPKEYASWVAPLPAGVKRATRAGKSVDLAHAFVTTRAELAKVLASHRKALGPEAVLWISWPKKSSGVATDVTEDAIRAVALPLGWVDVKVCAVSDVWSGLKLVVRKELR